MADVPGGKHPGQGSGHVPVGEDIAPGIRIQLVPDALTGRHPSDGHEHPLAGQHPVRFPAGFQPEAGDLRGAQDLRHNGVRQKPEVWGFLYPAAQGLFRPQGGAPVDEPDGPAQGGQVQGFADRAAAAADDADSFVPEKEAVAQGAPADPPAGEGRFPGNVQLSGGGSAGKDQGFPEEGLAPGPDFLCIPPEGKFLRLRGEHRHPRFLGHLEHPACQLRPSGLTGKPRVVSDPVRQQQLAPRSGSLQQQSLEPRPSAVEPGAEPRRTAADDQNVVNIQKNPRLSLVVFQGKAGICASLTGGAYSCEASSTRAFASRRVTWAQRWAARVSKVG